MRNSAAIAARPIAALAVALALTPAVAMAQIASDLTIDALPRGVALPRNADMRMAGGDPSALIKRLCGEVRSGPSTCEVFVQPDPKGGLIGYMKLETTPDGTVFETKSVTRDGRACLVDGKLEELTETDTTKDFQGRAMVEAITGRDVSGIPTTAPMVWHLERVGPRIRLNDERWNYCYRNRHVEDVWQRIGVWRRASYAGQDR